MLNIRHYSYLCVEACLKTISYYLSADYIANAK